MRPPGIIKKELIELRAALKRLGKKHADAVAAAGKIDHMLYLGARMEADMKVRDLRNYIDRTQRAIGALEVELVGDWKPKAWEKREA